MAPALWSRLPCEMIAMIAEYCDSSSLQNLTAVNQLTHQHVSRERRLRLQRANFHLYETEEERLADIARLEMDLHAVWSPDLRRVPVDVVTTVVIQGNVDAFALFLGWGLDIRRYNRDGMSILGVAFDTSNDAVGHYLLANKLVTADDVSRPVAIAPFLVRHANTLATLAVTRAKDWALEHFVDLAGEDIVPAIHAEAALEGYKTLRASTMERLLGANLPFLIGHVATGWNPVHFSLCNPDSAMLDLALERMPKTALHDLDALGESLLFHALNRQNYYALERLLACGVDPDIPNRQHLTLLHTACVHVDAKAVALLLKYNATPRVGASTVMGTSLNAFADGLWRNRGMFTREDAQAMFDGLVAAGARGERDGPDTCVEELIRIRFSMGYLHERELAKVCSG